MSAQARNWKDAFLRQAFSDFQVFRRFSEDGALDQCHLAHYLQMYTEKLAKSGLTDGSFQPPADHYSLVRFLRHAKQDREMRNRWRGTTREFMSMIDGLVEYASTVERLAPSGAVQAPNPEYPWADMSVSPEGRSAGTAHVPCEHHFEVLGPRYAPRLRKLLAFSTWYFELHGFHPTGELRTP